MYKTLIAALLITVGSGAPLLAFEPQFDVPIDPQASSFTVELCIPGGCDADTSSTGGYYTIALNSPSALFIELYDFQVDALESIDLDIGVFLGSLLATGADLSVRDAEPGVPKGPVPIVFDDFAFDDVLIASQGTVDYLASGTVCALLQAAGQPCSDTVDLGQQAPQSGPVDGTITVAGDMITLTIDLFIQTPLDPTNPDLGTLTISGLITGSATLPEAVIPAVSGWGLGLIFAGLAVAGAAIAARRGRPDSLGASSS